MTVIRDSGSYLGKGYTGEVHGVTLDGVNYAVKDQPFRGTDRISAVALREAVALSSLIHPNIIHLYHLCADNGRLILIMEAGQETLKQWITRDHSPLLAMKVASQIKCTIQFLHMNGLYHNDLLSTNIVMVDDSSTRTTLRDIRENMPLTGIFSLLLL